MSTIGGTGMTRVSETTNLIGGRGGQIIWEGPADASNPTLPATLSGVPISQTQATVRGGKKTFTATYDRLNFSVTGVSPNKTALRSSDGSANELPIRSHPDCDNPNDLDNPPIIDGKEFEGVESYLRPGIIYRRSVYNASYTFSEPNLTAGVGSRSTPAGLQNASANKWLKTGIDVQENADGSAVETTTWLFNPDGWPEEIYPD